MRDPVPSTYPAWVLNTCYFIPMFASVVSTYCLILQEKKEKYGNVLADIKFTIILVFFYLNDKQIP